MTKDGEQLDVPGVHGGVVLETAGEWIFVLAEGVGFNIRWNQKVKWK